MLAGVVFGSLALGSLIIRRRWPSRDTSYVREEVGGLYRLSNSLDGFPALKPANDPDVSAFFYQAIT